MVAVAGHGVEAPEFGLRLGQDGADRLQRAHGGGGDLAGVGAALGGHGDGLGLLRELGVVELDGAHGAAPVGGGVAGGEPQGLDDVVEPHEGEREPGHVQAGDELADLRVHDLQASVDESGADVVPHHEQLLVLRGAQAVDDGHHAGAGVLGAVGEEAVHEEAGDIVGGAELGVVNTGLPVDAQAHAHRARLHVEERLSGPGQGAAVEGDAEGAGAVVRPVEDLDDLVDAQARLAGRRRHLEDGQVPGDAAALEMLVGGSGGDVVGDQDAAGVDPLTLEALGGLPEVQDVPGVVAEADEDAGAPVRGLAHGVGLRGRRRGEDVPAHGAVGESLADPSGEGRVVARSAADDEAHLPGGGAGGAHDAAEDRLEVDGEGAGEAGDGLGGEVVGVVHESGHGGSAPSLLGW